MTEGTGVGVFTIAGVGKYLGIPGGQQGRQKEADDEGFSFHILGECGKVLLFNESI